MSIPHERFRLGRGFVRFDEAGAREVGELVWILPASPGEAAGRGPTARDRLAASHLEGLMR
jgi:hypothetical protein